MSDDYRCCKVSFLPKDPYQGQLRAVFLLDSKDNFMNKNDLNNDFLIYSENALQKNLSPVL